MSRHGTRKLQPDNAILAMYAQAKMQVPSNAISRDDFKSRTSIHIRTTGAPTQVSLGSHFASFMDKNVCAESLWVDDGAVIIFGRW